MHQQKSKKILIYFFLFLIIGTLNNKNLDYFNFFKIKKVEINGLSENNNFELLKNFDYIELSNLFFIDKNKINEIINSNDLVEKYSVFKKYPSSLKIDIIKTEFLANVKKGNEIFFLGSNGKFIKSNELNKNLPLIIGKFNKDEFFYLKKIIDQTNFEFGQIKDFVYFKSGRWNIKIYPDLNIKLPKTDIKESIELLVKVLEKIDTKKTLSIDLRQKTKLL